MRPRTYKMTSFLESEQLAVAAAGGRPRAALLKGGLQVAAPLLLLLAFVALPLARSVWDSFDGVAFSFARYYSIFTDELYHAVFMRTMRVAVVVTALSVFLGFPLAYFMTMISRRAAAITALFVLVPLFTAFLIRIYAWMTILGRGGVLNKSMMALGIIDAPIRILGTSTAVYIGMVHVLMPIAVLVMYSGMLRIDRTLITAAQVLGANRTKSFFRVYLPLCAPALVSASVLVFIFAMGFFIAPALLGSPSDTMITQLIVTQITSLLDLKVGYALSTSLLVVTVVVLLISNMFVPLEQMWLQESSLSVRRRRLPKLLIRLAGPLHVIQHTAEMMVDAVTARPLWLMPALLKVYVGVLLLFFVAPLLVVYILSFSSSPFLVFPPPGFSLQWYQKFFSSPEWWSALAMSLKLAVMTATLATAISAAAAFGLVRGQFGGKRMLFLFIISPLLIPGIVVALCAYVSMSDLRLVGTFTALVIGHLVGAVPTAIIILMAAVRGLDRNLENAAATLGATPATIIRKIILPLLAPALGSAWIMSFLHSFDELIVTMFLLGRQRETLPMKMWSDIHFQTDPVISAASSTIITVVAAVIIASQFRTLRSHPRTASQKSIS